MMVYALEIHADKRANLPEAIPHKRIFQPVRRNKS